MFIISPLRSRNWKVLEAHWQARLANPMRLGSMRDSVYKTEKKVREIEKD